MRSENAIYGGEMSEHHYFRDFAYCDSGMIPWLLVVDLMSSKKQTLSQLVNAYMAKYPCSGEINYRVNDVSAVLQRIEATFLKQAISTDHTDGLSMEFLDWRFNVRASNTEPLLRLNIEARADHSLVTDRVAYLEFLIHESN